MHEVKNDIRLDKFSKGGGGGGGGGGVLAGGGGQMPPCAPLNAPLLSIKVGLASIIVPHTYSSLLTHPYSHYSNHIPFLAGAALFQLKLQGVRGHLQKLA